MAAPTRPTVPEDWPETATLRGVKMDLRQAVATLDLDDVSQLVVDVPPMGPHRPWRFLLDVQEFMEDEDGELLVP